MGGHNVRLLVNFWTFLKNKDTNQLFSSRKISPFFRNSKIPTPTTSIELPSILTTSAKVALAGNMHHYFRKTKRIRWWVFAPFAMRHFGTEKKEQQGGVFGSIISRSRDPAAAAGPISQMTNRFVSSSKTLFRGVISTCLIFGLGAAACRKNWSKWSGVGHVTVT